MPLRTTIIQSVLTQTIFLKTFDARTKDAKSFLERMAKRKNGDKGTSQQYKDNDPKDLPMIKGEK